MRFTCVILGVFFCLAAGAEMATDASDEALIRAAEKLVAEAATPTASKTPADNDTEAAVAAASAPAAPITAAAKESEIPLQLTAPGMPKDSQSPYWRLAASLAFLAVIGGALFYASRRWSRPKDKSASGARIEMIHQYHMGPRKSVALIRVAGETILLGVTDTSVNLIKPVTLIDDELEGLMKKDFNNFLEDEFSIEDVRSALRT